MASRNFSDLWSGRGVFATNPFMEMQRDFNRLFGDTFRRTAPRVDVRESDDEVCVVADVPGVAPSDLDLRLDGTLLTISAERHGESEHTQDNYHVMERTRGLMRRAVQLPFAPDPEQVYANYENGVLTVRMPKVSQLKRGHRIDVHGSGPAGSSGGAAGASGGATAGGAASSGNVGVSTGGVMSSGTSSGDTGASSARSTEAEGRTKPAEGVA